MQCEGTGDEQGHAVFCSDTHIFSKTSRKCAAPCYTLAHHGGSNSEDSYSSISVDMKMLYSKTENVQQHVEISMMMMMTTTMCVQHCIIQAHSMYVCVRACVCVRAVCGVCQCGVCVHACVCMCACVCMKVHKFPRITYYTSCMLQDVRMCSHVHACLSVCLSVCPSASDSPERSAQHSALRFQRECVQYKRATETAEGAGGIPHLTSPAREHANP